LLLARDCVFNQNANNFVAFKKQFASQGEWPKFKSVSQGIASLNQRTKNKVGAAPNHAPVRQFFARHRQERRFEFVSRYVGKFLCQNRTNSCADRRFAERLLVGTQQNLGSRNGCLPGWLSNKADALAEFWSWNCAGPVRTLATDVG
jgi:hypothetical protein